MPEEGAPTSEPSFDGMTDEELDTLADLLGIDKTLWDSYTREEKIAFLKEMTGPQAPRIAFLDLDANLKNSGVIVTEALFTDTVPFKINAPADYPMATGGVFYLGDGGKYLKFYDYMIVTEMTDTGIRTVYLPRGKTYGATCAYMDKVLESLEAVVDATGYAGLKEGIVLGGDGGQVTFAAGDVGGVKLVPDVGGAGENAIPTMKLFKENGMYLSIGGGKAEVPAGVYTAVASIVNREKFLNRDELEDENQLFMWTVIKEKMELSTNYSWRIQDLNTTWQSWETSVDVTDTEGTPFTAAPGPGALAMVSYNITDEFGNRLMGMGTAANQVGLAFFDGDAKLNNLQALEDDQYTATGRFVTTAAEEYDCVFEGAGENGPISFRTKFHLVGGSGGVGDRKPNAPGDVKVAADWEKNQAVFTFAAATHPGAGSRVEGYRLYALNNGAASGPAIATAQSSPLILENLGGYLGGEGPWSFAITAFDQNQRESALSNAATINPSAVEGGVMAAAGGGASLSQGIYTLGPDNNGMVNVKYTAKDVSSATARLIYRRPGETAEEAKTTSAAALVLEGDAYKGQIPAPKDGAELLSVEVLAAKAGKEYTLKGDLAWKVKAHLGISVANYANLAAVSRVELRSPAGKIEVFEGGSLVLEGNVFTVAILRDYYKDLTVYLHYAGLSSRFDNVAVEGDKADLDGGFMEDSVTVKFAFENPEGYRFSVDAKLYFYDEAGGYVASKTMTKVSGDKSALISKPAGAVKYRAEIVNGDPALAFAAAGALQPVVNETVKVDVTVSPFVPQKGQSLQVTMDGKPLKENIFLSLYRSDEKMELPVKAVWYHASGQLNTEGISPGTYTVTADGAKALGSAQVAIGGGGGEDLALQRAAIISGRIRLLMEGTSNYPVTDYKAWYTDYSGRQKKAEIEVVNFAAGADQEVVPYRQATIGPIPVRDMDTAKGITVQTGEKADLYMYIPGTAGPDFAGFPMYEFKGSEKIENALFPIALSGSTSVDEEFTTRYDFGKRDLEVEKAYEINVLAKSQQVTEEGTPVNLLFADTKGSGKVYGRNLVIPKISQPGATGGKIVDGVPKGTYDIFWYTGYYDPAREMAFLKSKGATVGKNSGTFSGKEISRQKTELFIELPDLSQAKTGFSLLSFNSRNLFIAKDDMAVYHLRFTADSGMSGKTIRLAAEEGIVVSKSNASVSARIDGSPAEASVVQDGNGINVILPGIPAGKQLEGTVIVSVLPPASAFEDVENGSFQLEAKIEGGESYYAFAYPCTFTHNLPARTSSRELELSGRATGQGFVVFYADGKKVGSYKISKYGHWGYGAPGDHPLLLPSGAFWGSQQFQIKAYQTDRADADVTDLAPLMEKEVEYVVPQTDAKPLTVTYAYQMGNSEETVAKTLAFDNLDEFNSFLITLQGDYTQHTLKLELEFAAADVPFVAVPVFYQETSAFIIQRSFTGKLTKSNGNVVYSYSYPANLFGDFYFSYQVLDKPYYTTAQPPETPAITWATVIQTAASEAETDPASMKNALAQSALSLLDNPQTGTGREEMPFHYDFKDLENKPRTLKGTYAVENSFRVSLQEDITKVPGAKKSNSFQYFDAENTTVEEYAGENGVLRYAHVSAPEEVKAVEENGVFKGYSIIYEYVYYYDITGLANAPAAKRRDIWSDAGEMLGKITQKYVEVKGKITEFLEPAAPVIDTVNEFKESYDSLGKKLEFAGDVASGLTGQDVDLALPELLELPGPVKKFKGAVGTAGEVINIIVEDKLSDEMKAVDQYMFDLRQCKAFAINRCKCDEDAPYAGQINSIYNQANAALQAMKADVRMQENVNDGIDIAQKITPSKLASIPGMIVEAVIDMGQEIGNDVTNNSRWYAARELMMDSTQRMNHAASRCDPSQCMEEEEEVVWDVGELDRPRPPLVDPPARVPVRPKFILDPSGVVYEGMPANTLDGATCTIYYEDGGNWVKWDAGEALQINPLETDKTGWYKWDVPRGRWKVVYEKDGYQKAESAVMPVPPIWLDVNQNLMTSDTTPTASAVSAGGQIVITFSKPIQLADLNATSAAVTIGGGKAAGTWTAIPGKSGLGTVYDGGGEEGIVFDDTGKPANAALGEKELAIRVKFAPESKPREGAAFAVDFTGVRSYGNKPIAQGTRLTGSIAGGEAPPSGGSPGGGGGSPVKPQVTELAITAPYAEETLTIGSKGGDFTAIGGKAALSVEEKSFTTDTEVKISAVRAQSGGAAAGQGLPGTEDLSDRYTVEFAVQPKDTAQLSVRLEHLPAGADPRHVILWVEESGKPGQWKPAGGVYNEKENTLTILTRVNGTYVARLSSRSFPDAAASHWAKSPLELLAARGIISGDPSGNVRPDMAISRAETAALIVNVLQANSLIGRLPEVKDNFRDVRPESWYYYTMNLAAKRGLFTGNGEGYARPEDTITREELAAVFAKLMLTAQEQLDFQKVDPKYSDADRISGWAKGSVAGLREKGFMQGSGGAFRPGDDATRAEVAAMLVKMMDYYGLIAHREGEIPEIPCLTCPYSR